MRRIVAVSGISVLLLAACGGGNTGSVTNSGGQPETEVSVSIESTGLGDVLVGEGGRTLYMFVPDQQGGAPTCYDDCAKAWPALEATDDRTAASGLDQSKLGTVERTDGATQVTYKDLPLYYFSGDKSSGDTNGQGLNDVWWVISSAGEPVREGPADAGGQTGSDDDY